MVQILKRELCCAIFIFDHCAFCLNLNTDNILLWDLETQEVLDEIQNPTKFDLEMLANFCLDYGNEIHLETKSKANKKLAC